MACVGCTPPPPNPQKRVVKVRVWYPDAVYDNPDWSELPELGLQVVMLYFADGTRRIMQGDDYFFRCGDTYGHTSNRADLEKYPGAAVVRGMWLPDDIYYGIVDEAMGN